MKYILLLFILGIIPAAFANEEMAAPEGASVLEMPKTPRSGFNYFLSANYAAVDIPILSKYGVTAGYISSPDQTWELEYMTGSVGSSILLADIASIKDTKISLMGRSYFGGSFYLSYGVSYFDFSITLGDEFMSSVSGSYPSADILSIQGWGLTAGLGNKWTLWDNVNLGIEWLCFSQPLLITKKDASYIEATSNPESRDDVQTAVDILSYLPRISMIQVHIGMMF